jgi:hypothetical protein
MATNDPPVGPGPGLTTDATEVLAAFVAAQSTMLHQFAAEEATRLEQLKDGHARLVKGGGASDERIRSIAAEIERTEAFRSDLATAAERQGRVPPIKEGETIVHGRIVDAAGQPQPGVTVALDDEGHAFGDTLGVAVTDEFGDFSMTYKDADLAKLRSTRPDLTVTVGDATTKTLHRTPSDIRFEAGPVEYLEVVMPEGVETSGKKPTPRRSSGTKKRATNTSQPTDS